MKRFYELSFSVLLLQTSHICVHIYTIMRFSGNLVETRCVLVSMAPFPGLFCFWFMSDWVGYVWTVAMKRAVMLTKSTYWRARILVVWYRKLALTNQPHKCLSTFSNGNKTIDTFCATDCFLQRFFPAKFEMQLCSTPFLSIKFSPRYLNNSIHNHAVMT